MVLLLQIGMDFSIWQSERKFSNNVALTYGKRTGTGVNTFTCTLPYTYSNTNYQIVISRTSAYAATTTGGLYWGNQYHTKTVSNFQTGADFGNQASINYITLGY